MFYPNPRSGNVHCDYCCCPKEIWKPLDTYPTDRSCEFYDDVYSMACDLERATDFVFLESLLRKCDGFRGNYPDVADFEATVCECFDIFEDTGCFKTKKPCHLKLIPGGAKT